jgi:hypothetical protein
VHWPARESLGEIAPIFVRPCAQPPEAHNGTDVPDWAVLVMDLFASPSEIGTRGLAGTCRSREKSSTDRVDVEIRVGVRFTDRFEGNLESGRKRPRGHFGTRLVDQPQGWSTSRVDNPERVTTPVDAPSGFFRVGQDSPAESRSIPPPSTVLEPLHCQVECQGSADWSSLGLLEGVVFDVPDGSVWSHPNVENLSAWIGCEASPLRSVESPEPVGI